MGRHSRIVVFAPGRPRARGLYHKVSVGVIHDRAADLFTALGGSIARNTRVGNCVGWVFVEEEAKAVQPASFPP